MSLSEQLIYDGIEKRHMLGAFDGQLVDRVVVDHFRNALKRLAELAKDKLPFAVVHNLHVHEATCTLQGERVIMLGTFAVTDKVTAFFEDPQQILGIQAADGTMVPPLFLERHAGVHLLAHHAERGAAEV